MKHIIALFALVASLFVTTAYSQEKAEISVQSAPIVPFDVIVGGRASVESYLFKSFATAEFLVYGQSAVGREEERTRRLSVAELMSRGYIPGSAQSLEGVFQNDPIRGVEVAPVNGHYDVQIRVELFSKEGIVLFRGYSAVQINEVDGRLVATPTPVIFTSNTESIAISGNENTRITAAGWLSGNWQVPSLEIPIVDNRAIVPVSSLNSGTLVLTVNQRGFTGAVAIDLNGHTVIAEAEKIDLHLRKISAEDGFIHIIREGIKFPEVTFWESHSVFGDVPGTVIGVYPVVELTPPLVGGEVTFSPRVTVFGREGRYFSVPSSIVVRDVLSGIDKTILPDSNGKFSFTFPRAQAYHLFLKFKGVVDPRALLTQ